MVRELVLTALLTATCGLSGCGVVSNFPPPPGDYGRPAIVRGFARAGTYVGATVGIVAAAVFYYPGKALNMMVDEPLGYTEKEWPYVPLTASATVGHYIFGLPAEVLHFVFWGAWVSRPDPDGFEHVPVATEPRRD
jgi:hypothetical protein